MRRIFLDTSAILALRVPTDRNHARARRIFSKLAAEEAALVTTSYVLVETYALLGRRFGPAEVRAFRETLAPLLDIVWVEAPLHERGLDLLLHRDKRRLSLVDAVSFLVVRERKLDAAFAFDRDFDDEGLPGL